MRVTRYKNKKSHLSMASWKYWVYAVYKDSKRPEVVGVATTQDIRNLVTDYDEEEYTEFRLITGYPIRAHADKQKNKILKSMCEKHPDKSILPQTATEYIVNKSVNSAGRWCPRCKKKILKKPFNKLCRTCVQKMVSGNISKQNVYGLYSGAGELLYVGVTSNPLQRAHDHFKSNKKFARMEIIENFQDRVEAEAFETFCIYHLVPPLNILVKAPNENWLFDVKELDRFGTVSNRKRKHRVISEIPVR